MRIISGKYRGKILQPGKKFSARPTTDFAKESLFNIIQNHFDFEGLKILDLFAGTGSIGFEFASRDSESVDSVEVNHAHFSFIRKTAQDLGFSRMNVYKMDAFAFIKRCTSIYDIIFADPPYELKGIKELPAMIFERKLLKDGGWFILEHSGNYDFHDDKHFREVRKYGSVNFSFFEI